MAIPELNQIGDLALVGSTDLISKSPLAGKILFISDLHLCEERPEITRLFLLFLQQTASQCQALYILGDLFEAWLGDDDNSAHNARVVDALRSLTATGVAVFFMHGNRDFLLGADFAASSGGRLLPDPSVIDLFGQATLVSHGDILCTQDLAYQQVRKQIRTDDWQSQFLSLSLTERAALAHHYRQQSRAETSIKSEDIMDVEQSSVEQLMLAQGVTTLIHGHTHRPAVHDFSLHNQSAQRIVLGDWYEQGSVLYCDEHGCQLKAYST